MVYFLIFLFFFSGQAFSSERVQEVRVQIRVRSGEIDSAITERIRNSIRAVSEKVFLNLDLPSAVAMKPQALDTMRKILNRVITGFYIKQLDVVVAPVLEVDAMLVPENKVVEKVRIEIEPIAIHPFWRPLLRKKADKILPTLAPILKGIPVQAEKWAVEAVVPVLEARLSVEELFAGFDTEIQIDLAKETIVKLRLIPTQPVIERTYVSVRTEEFPFFFRQILRFALNQESHVLSGLPVEFLKRNFEYLQSYWKSRVMGKRKGKYGITVEVTSKIGEQTTIFVVIHSANIRVWAEGLVNGGNIKPNPELRGMLWWRLNPWLHTALRLEVAPENLKFKGQVGLLFRPTEHIAIAPLLELNTIEDIEWMMIEVKKWQLLGVGQIGRNRGEASIGYWVKPYIRLDAVYRSQQGNYIRMAIRF